MGRIILLNKPYGVLCQFSDEAGRKTLKDYVNLPKVYPAGRLDLDSEGLVVLTDDGTFQAHISSPKFKLPKTYWVQVEGEISQSALAQLERGVLLNDGMTQPAQVKRFDGEPMLWAREPPIRTRQNIPTSWLALTITEGRNRQVRRMTAAVGFPTLRLVRVQVGAWRLSDLALGAWRELNSSEMAAFTQTLPREKPTPKRFGTPAKSAKVTTFTVSKKGKQQ